MNHLKYHLSKKRFLPKNFLDEIEESNNSREFFFHIEQYSFLSFNYRRLLEEDDTHPKLLKLIRKSYDDEDIVGRTYENRFYFKGYVRVRVFSYRWRNEIYRGYQNGYTNEIKVERPNRIEFITSRFR